MLSLGFLGRSLFLHWSTVLTLRWGAHGWVGLGCALGATLLAHVWAAWVWGDILKLFGTSVTRNWVMETYLITNLAKYIPGNIWHFVGRVRALSARSVPVPVAVMGVVLEPLLMAAAALGLAFWGNGYPRSLQAAVLGILLVAVHPHWSNPLLHRLSVAKLKQMDVTAASVKGGLSAYPLKPLLGEIGFVLLRAVGFVLVVMALEPVTPQQWGILISHFSLAWVLGLVAPGAPGGVGVFEAVAVALLSPPFPAASILGSVALYRILSIVAESIGAGLSLMNLWLARKR